MSKHFRAVAAFSANFIFASLLGAAADERCPTQSEMSCAENPPVVVLPPICGVSLSPPTISCAVPDDVEGEFAQENQSLVQRASNIFSWQEFIALNWPADDDKRGRPKPNASINDPGLRVWQTWKAKREVFLDDGGKPLPWKTYPPVLPRWQRGPRQPVLTMIEKTDNDITVLQQAVSAQGPPLEATLTDQRKHLVRYEIRMNEVAFNHIVEHQLYSSKDQATVDRVQFPPGSMFVKAAWKEVTDQEAARFYTTEAVVADRDKKHHRLHSGEQKLMGLVGLHFMHKTKSARQWVWSTFEHVDNVDGPTPSFRDPDCRDCAENRQTLKGEPNQVKRLTQIPSDDPDCDHPDAATDNVVALNDAVQQALPDSVFRFYELINTQWPQVSAAEPSTAFTATPPLLANVTMETFVQETSSCMGCHSTARTARYDTFVSADFTFSLNDAKPAPPDLNVIPAPEKPSTDWEIKAWPLILRGQQITSRTYELLPDYVSLSRLHCTSCHLDDGRNRDSAWWVGAIYRQSMGNGIESRIQHCFQFSMNGKPIPRDGDEMRALVTYMQWLDTQRPDDVKKSGGYPDIAGLEGDPKNGRNVFVQKCAVCHGNDGLGRYQDGAYFRPALWGPHSFNDKAGMGTLPHELEKFVRWNMPFNSGGLLTDQEAWDVAAYIRSPTHYRPPYVAAKDDDE